MNAHTRELIDKVRVKYSCSECGESPYYMAQLVESIVRECAQIAKDTQDWYAENNPSGIVNTDIGAKIKQQFGIEL